MEILDFTTMLVNLACTFLLARLCIWGWPVGLVGLTLSGFLFGFSGLYADMVLQIIMFVSFAYGWYKWSYKKSHGEFLSSIKRLTLKGWATTVVIVTVLTLAIAWVLATYTDSTTIYLDAFTSATSLVCMYLAAKEYIDNWLIWLLVDSIYIFLYSYKGIPFAAFTTFVYLIIAVIGYRHWSKQKQNAA